MVRRTKLLPQTQFKEVTTFTTLILHEIYKNACIKIYLLIYLIYLFVLPIFLFPYLFICECICIFKHIHIEKYACPSLSLSYYIYTFCFLMDTSVWSLWHGPDSEESAIAADSSRMRPLGKAAVLAKPRSLSLISLKARQWFICKRIWGRYYCIDGRHHVGYHTVNSVSFPPGRTEFSHAQDHICQGFMFYSSS